MSLRARPCVFVGAALALAGTAQAQPKPGARTDEAAFQRNLQAELAAHGADVHGCWALALDAHPDLSGEVLFRLWLDGAGAVTRAEVLKDQLGYGPTTDCLLGAMAKWRMPKVATGESIEVVFPLAFKPEGKGARTFVVPLSDGKPGPLPGGKIDARVLIDERAVGPTGASLTRLVLSPSTRVALHTHPALELLYVVKGIAHLRDGFGSAPVSAEAGDLIVAPPNVAHNVEAAPLAPLELLQIFVPGGPEIAYLDPKRREGTVPAKKGKPAAQAVAFPAAPMVVKAGPQKPLAILGGKGSAALLLDALGLREASLQRFDAEPGAKMPEHQHADADEILFVLAGHGDLTVAGAVTSLGPGDAIHIPKATPHALAVTEKLVAVQLYSPAGPEQRFKSPAADRVSKGSAPPKGP